ncbi:MAG: hypothetical protein M1828_007284 [Chrysothrix sp. TS-e1954]|nr:MAG: hypothetical protein M1828_007284 [Chrysothrix sp. TS-e1954]
MSNGATPETSSKAVRIPTTFNGSGISLAAIVNYPAGFDASRSSHYSAVVVSHPSGGVKEQTSGLYARKLAETGLLTVAFDASYQGESSGEPRQLDNPHIRTEDVSSVIDYLAALPYVNAARIGSMGVCAGGGFAAAATIRDRRIAALATVNAVNAGTLARNGMDGKGPDAGALQALAYASSVRTADAASDKPAQTTIIPSDKEEATKGGLLEGWEYYHDRCRNANAPVTFTTRSLMQTATFDAFQYAESMLTQPLLVVVGSEAFSKFMGEELHAKAVSKDKRLHVVKNASHMEVYDDANYVKEITKEVAGFFQSKLIA